MSTRRLNKELVTYPKKGAIQFKGCVNDNVMEQQWIVIPSAGDSTAFDGLEIAVSVTIPGEYPFKAPNVKLHQTLFHPNVHGLQLCLDKVNNWQPKFRVTDVMEEVLNVIMYPNPDTALNTAAANLYNTNRSCYVQRATKELFKAPMDLR